MHKPRQRMAGVRTNALVALGAGGGYGAAVLGGAAGATARLADLERTVVVVDGMLKEREAAVPKAANS